MTIPSSSKLADHIAKIASPHQEMVLAIRQIFLNADDHIAEHIKWNSPSFYYTGAIKEFKANEYKRDIAVINLHRGNMLIVFPTGNRIDDQIPLKGENYPDGRKIVPIESLEDISRNSMLLTQAIRDWIAGIER